MPEDDLFPAAYQPGGSDFPLFLDKLIEKTKWSKHKARAAVKEYLRFLTIIARFGAKQTPSAAVDEVWHIHLQFTKDYWEYLCPKILGINLHHVPTGKSPEEKVENRSHYASTLQHYQELFGDPPAEFWPQPRHGRRLRPINKFYLSPAAVVFSLALLCCIGATNFTFLPKVSGRDFLLYYGIILVVYNILSALGLYLDRTWRKADRASPFYCFIVFCGWLLIWIVGGLRIYHGIVNGYPVTYLIYELIGGALVVPMFTNFPAAGIELPASSGSSFTSNCSSCSTCSSCGGGCGGGCGGCGGD